MSTNIFIQNASENNLKSVTVTIPQYKLTVVTGVSGSGKSSLIFDTLAAESRRALNDTYSSFIQQYLPKYGRPNVEKIDNMPVAFVVDQKKISDNARSTLGTYTDIYTYLRLLFSRFGSPHIGYSDIFSFNHPNGKCPKCDGLGYTNTIDIQKFVDYDKSLNDGPFDFPTFYKGFWRWQRYANSGLFDLDKKIKDYTKDELDLFLHSPQIKLKNPPKEWPHTALYEGLIPRLRRSVINKTGAKRYKQKLDTFVTTGDCPECGGTRVNKTVRSCRINNTSIADAVLMPLDKLYEFIENIDNEGAQDIKKETCKRIKSLIDIGLSYLNLARSTSTLSGGESQRVKIAKYINSSLTNIMYILDEPSVGLHPKDIVQLKIALYRLRDAGNTVILVEHNIELIKVADYIIDMGPGAGDLGGQKLYEGKIDGLLQLDTPTAKSLQEKIPIKIETRSFDKCISIRNCTKNNLKNISVDIPLGVMTVICGVAGSGKSSLMQTIANIKTNQEIISISQKNIGVNIRSTPLTYLGIFDTVRALFAKTNKVSAALFSYNSKGACLYCKGKGIIVSDMSFMDDVITVCEVCQGKRYNQEVLQYKYNGKNIVEVLEMTVQQAVIFFDHSEIHDLLQTLLDVGLDYLHLDQPLTTLSGGELQRIKLATLLHNRNVIFLLDEPTAGLHLKDALHLLRLFNRLIDQGNTVILSEHNLAMIKQADWLIELGLEGGEKGGKILFTGTPTSLSNSNDIITRPYL